MFVSNPLVKTAKGTIIPVLEQAIELVVIATGTKHFEGISRNGIAYSFDKVITLFGLKSEVLPVITPL